MNPLPPGPKSKGKPAPVDAAAREQTRGLVPATNNMATTLSQPAASYPTLPPPQNFRPQLPPLVPSPTRSCLAPTSFTHALESPTTSLSSAISWSQTRGSHTNIQSNALSEDDMSSGQHRRLSGDESSVDGSSIPPQGIKRQRDASASNRMQNENSFHPQSSFLPAAMPGPPNTMIPTSRPAGAIPRSAPATSSYPSAAAYSRIKLHVRQHPRAARAGPDGKDRRTIDPPPVLQLLIDDFDPEKDVHLLKANNWVVYVKLMSGEEPREDLSTVANHSDGSHNNDKKVTRLLLGTNVSSPFFCLDDPDPDNAPRHLQTKPSPPPSPSMRFIKTSNRNAEQAKDPEAYKTFPGAFFIFADLSVRKAGQYRLEFRLMKMDSNVLVPGCIVPCLSIAVTDIFNVVNAKDFDQVQPSTNLIKGLLDRGAPFPLKLKKGLREGQRRKPQGGEFDDEDEDESQDEDDAG